MRHLSLAPFLRSTAVAAILAVGLAGCQTAKSPDVTGSLNARADAGPGNVSRNEVEAYGERYRAKVERAGAVIGRMAMPLAGVYGVENEEVVKDLVRASDLPYSYVHRTLNTLDGMDFALLYYADRFFTERIETGYGYLCVEGMLDGKPTAVLLTRGDRYAAELLEELRERTPGIQILCAGKLPSGTAEKLSLRDALTPAERRGRGNAYARGGWWLHDRILTDTTLTVIRADVFARRDLLDPRSGTPLPTYRRQRYTGGIGRYFPIFLYIK